MVDPCKYFVVSIDAMTIARVVSEGMDDEQQCDAAAEHYYETRALPGEAIRVFCKHHPLMQVLQQHRPN